MPTTSQGLLIFNNTAPEVFFSLSATTILSAPVVASVGITLLLLLVIYPFIRSVIHEMDKALDQGSQESFIIRRAASSIIPSSFIIQWIYVVVTIEQTIQQNPVIQNGPRFLISFGQVCCSFQLVDDYVCWNSSKIFPVVTIGACLVSICNDLWEARREPPISQGNDSNDLGTSIKADV